MSETSRFIPSTNDVEVALHDLGGEGPVLFFSHATGFHGRCYLPVAEALADRFHCYGVDLRGHGDSKFPDGLSMSWKGMAEDLAASVQAVADDEPVFAVGHSMGGAAIVLASLNHPTMFRAGWLFEPILFPAVTQPPDAENNLAASARKRREVFDSYDAAFERYASRPPFSQVDPVALRAYVDHGFEPLDDGTVRLKCRGAIEAEVFENSNNGGFEQLPNAMIRTAIVMSGDGQGPATFAPAVADELPNGELLSYPDLNHFGPFQDPSFIAEAIADYFSQ